MWLNFGPSCKGFSCEFWDVWDSLVRYPELSWIYGNKRRVFMLALISFLCVQCIELQFVVAVQNVLCYLVIMH